MAVLTHIVRRLCGGGLRRRHLVVGLGLLLCLGPRLAAVDKAPSAEFQLKAVFLFNFAQFVEWPARAWPTADAPLVIGVIGDDPFGTYLDELVRNEKVGAHPLAIQRLKRADDVAGCHILFFSRSEVDALDPALEALRGRSVLTVSDLDSFSRKGGMVRFVMEAGKIRLRINVEAAKAGELKISSKILRPATVVTQGKD